jgi:hypothetical protein
MSTRDRAARCLRVPFLPGGQVDCRSRQSVKDTVRSRTMSAITSTMRAVVAFARGARAISACGGAYLCSGSVVTGS